MPLFPAVAGDQEVWLSLGELGRGGRLVKAVFPSRDRTRWMPTQEPVLVLDADERELLREIAGLEFVSPAERPRDTTPWGRRMRERLRSLRHAWSRLWSPFASYLAQFQRPSTCRDALSRCARMSASCCSSDAAER